MEIVIQKFGGTSVASDELREKVFDIVNQKKKDGFLPVVVVSAIGRKGAPYATDTLINFANEKNIDINSRELDLIMSCGEIISAVVLTSLFQSKGVKSITLTGAQAGIITSNQYGSAQIIKVVPDRIKELLREGIIPIVTGFQGINEMGDITTLGRGGSDTTASALGMALKAKSVEIYTDVDGIMTADPKMVPNAKVLSQISYHEVFQMAEQGAKVIHPQSVYLAMESNVPVIIKNTLSKAPGTVITNSQYNLEGAKPGEKIITGVAYIPNRAQVTIETSTVSDVEIFDTLADNNISIDLINIFHDRKVFTINEYEVPKFEKLFEEKKIKYTIVDKCAKVTIIGNRMRGVPGVMDKIVNALAKHNIEILQTADSHTTISCLVKSEHTAKAVCAIHDEFKMNEY